MNRSFHSESIVSLIMAVFAFFGPRESLSQIRICLGEACVMLAVFILSGLVISSSNMKKMNMIGLIEFWLFVVLLNFIIICKCGVVIIRYALSINYIFFAISLLIFLLAINEFAKWMRDFIYISTRGDE